MHPKPKTRCFTSLSLTLLAWVGFSRGSVLFAEETPEPLRQTAVAPNSVVEMLQRIYQEQDQLRRLRLERVKLQSDLEKAAGEAEGLASLVQAMPETTKSGEKNLKRQPAERRLASLQSRINFLNQKLGKLDDEADSLSVSRKLVALALVRRIGAFLIFALVIWFLARLLRRIPARVVKEEQDRFYINKVITYSGRLLVIVVFLYTLFGELLSLSAFLGLTGAGIAIALQDVIVSFVAWFFIISRRGLSLGDRIEVAGVRGDVIDIGVLRIVLQEVGNWMMNDLPTGRRVFIPNSFAFKNHFFNHTKPQPFINDEIKLTFTFESDWESTLALVKETASGVMREYFSGDKASQEPLPQDLSFSQWNKGLPSSMPGVFTRIAENGVEVRIVYFSRVRQRNPMRDAMNRAILKALASHPEIALAYPTTRAIPTPPGTKP